MPQKTRPQCPDCGAPLEVDGVCLACLFGEALDAKESARPEGSSDSSFASFAPPEAGGFGQYTLRRKIGAGGMGVIWEAEETAQKRVVALKMIRGFAFSTDAEKLRFRAEAAAVAQLDHPNIVPIYEVGETEGQPFFTMQLLRGGSLSRRLIHGALAAGDAARIMEKLARAVHHAHQRGVLHRDLKPGNVLFDEAGEPYLTDFGLAKLVDAEHGLTLTNAHVGTPQYMSPEQARGRSRDITTASDVWALGAMFYQMLTGKLPFPGSDAAEIFNRITHDEPAPMRTAASSADRGLETLCLRCLEKEPARRLPGAGELAEELGRWLKGEPIHARRVTGGERAIRWMRRHPWRVAAASALVVSLMAGTIVSLLLWRSAEGSRREAEASSRTATEHAAAERLTGYLSTMGAALAARERHDFSRARQLLAVAPEEHRGFEWRLLDQLCAGDQRSLFRLPGGGIPEALGPGPDGQSLAVVSDSGLLHLFSPDGHLLREPRRLPELAGGRDPGKLTPLNFHGLRYAPEGRHFACTFRNTIRVFDAETLEVIMERSAITGVQSAWLDENRLLYGWDISTSLAQDMGAWIFDVRDNRAVRLPPGWTAPLAVSPDRSIVALTGGAQYHVAMFRAADLRGPAPLEGATPVADWQPQRNFSANILALSPDGKYIAALTGPLDAPSYRLEVAEPATGRFFVAQGFREAMTGLAFHPSEPVVALSSADAVVRMFNFLKKPPDGAPTYDDDCPPVTREPIDGNGVHSPPGRLLTRSAQDGRAVFLLGHEGRGTGVQFSADGASVFTSSADGTVRCWDTGVPTPPTRISDAHLHKLELHPSASPDGSRVLYVQRYSYTLRCWREGKGSVSLAEGHMPLAVLPEGRLATMERSTSDIVLWQEDGENIRQAGRIPGPGYIQGFSGLLRGVVSPDGTRIAGMTPGRIFVVNLTAQAVTATGDQGWQTGPARTWDIAFSPDGRRLVATGLGHEARIYDPADLTKPALPVGGFRNYDTALAFHPDGSRLYCGNEDGQVRVFDTSAWTEVPGESWQTHRGPVTAMAMSHDSTLIATAGDTTLKLWRARKAAGAARIALQSFTTYRPAAWLQFARDAGGVDRALMLCPPFGPLEIWHAPPGDRRPVRPTDQLRLIGLAAAERPDTPIADAVEFTTNRFRLIASSAPGDVPGAPLYAGYRHADVKSNGDAPVSLVPADSPDSTPFVFTRVEILPLVDAFRIENYPAPAGIDVSRMDAYLLAYDHNEMVAQYIPKAKKSGRAQLVAKTPLATPATASGSGQFLSFESPRFRSGHFLKRTGSKVFLAPPDAADRDFDRDATWEIEPLP